jgi:hypothetical protein
VGSAHTRTAVFPDTDDIGTKPALRAACSSSARERLISPVKTMRSPGTKACP